MANLSEDIQCAGSDTRPPMLNKTDFASWQQRIRLYCRGKENEVPDRPRSIRICQQDEKDRCKQTFGQQSSYIKEGSEVTTERTADESQLYDDFEHFGRQNRGQGNNAQGAGAASYGGAQNRVGNANPGQARQVKCYNCNRVGHIARNCTQPKHPQNSQYFKDKMLLDASHRDGLVLDEEQLLFLAGGQDNAIDEDVDEQPVQDLALNVDKCFKLIDCRLLSISESMRLLGINYVHGKFIVCRSEYDKPCLYQNNASTVPNDMYVMIDNDLHEPKAQSVFKAPTYTVADNSLNAELAIYKEQVELYERRARKKMHDKMKANECVDNKVNITPPNYLKENFLATFILQKQLTPEQIFWSQDIVKMNAEALKEVRTQTKSKRDSHNVVKARCLELEAELSNLRDNIHKDNYNELLNRFSNLEVNHLNLQLKYQNLKDSFQNKPSSPVNDTPDFNSVFVIGQMKASLQGKDNVIQKLKMQISQLKETRSELDRTLDFRARDFQISQLTEKVNVLQEQNELFRAENAKIKQHYKELYDSIKITRAKHTEQITALKNENESLKVQLQNTVSCVTTNQVKPNVLAPGKYAIDVEPIPPRNRNNREKLHIHYIRAS
ncbi:retrovirus-related pol polyprotein from transposon TNT 1-94 [Tanacetum coccineum]